MKGDVEELASTVEGRSLLEACQHRRCDVEGEPARALVEVDLAGRGPGMCALGNNALHERHIYIHRCAGERWAPEPAVVSMCGIVHIQETLADRSAEDRRPALIVAEILTVCMQHEAICGWTNHEH